MYTESEVITSPRFVALHRLVSEVQPEAVYLFLQELLFTAIFVVCSLKSMCIPSFVLIGCCASLA